MSDEKPRILVVDDESDTLLFLYDLLSSAGYFVEGSSNPLDALEDIRRRQPTLVLADLRMPEMDGFELVRRVRAASPKTRVLLMSAVADDAAASTGAAAGAEAFLRKPLCTGELLAVVEKLAHQIAG